MHAITFEVDERIAHKTSWYRVVESRRDVSGRLQSAVLVQHGGKGKVANITNQIERKKVIIVESSHARYD